MCAGPLCGPRHKNLSNIFGTGIKDVTTSGRNGHTHFYYSSIVTRSVLPGHRSLKLYKEQRWLCSGQSVLGLRTERTRRRQSVFGPRTERTRPNSFASAFLAKSAFSSVVFTNPQTGRIHHRQREQLGRFSKRKAIFPLPTPTSTG